MLDRQAPHQPALHATTNFQVLDVCYMAHVLTRDAVEPVHRVSEEAGCCDPSNDTETDLSEIVSVVVPTAG